MGRGRRTVQVTCVSLHNGAVRQDPSLWKGGTMRFRFMGACRQREGGRRQARQGSPRASSGIHGGVAPIVHVVYGCCLEVCPRGPAGGRIAAPYTRFRRVHVSGFRFLRTSRSRFPRFPPTPPPASTDSGPPRYGGNHDVSRLVGVPPHAGAVAPSGCRRVGCTADSSPG